MLKVCPRRQTKKDHQVGPWGGNGKVKMRQTFTEKDSGVNNSRLELLDKICRNVKAIEQEMPLISNITEMTRYALNASASSPLLLDEVDKGLLYDFADGPLGKQLKRLQTNKLSGIQGWVMRNGNPLIVKDISKNERFKTCKDEVTSLVARLVICAPLVSHNTIIGVLEVLNKLDGNDFDDDNLRNLVLLATNAAQTIENFRLNENLLYTCKGTVQKLVSLLDVRESTVSKHSRRVSEYALIGASKLQLSDKELKNIESAAIHYDIGLLSIPRSILNKREALTKEEWNLIRKHPVIGYNLLRGIPSLNQVSKLILYHHERYDGKGYPCGLKGETIPIGARLIAVADAFDSMTVKHSYRAALSTEDALAEIGRCTVS